MSTRHATLEIGTIAKVNNISLYFQMVTTDDLPRCKLVLMILVALQEDKLLLERQEGVFLKAEYVQLEAQQHGAVAVLNQRRR